MMYHTIIILLCLVSKITGMQDTAALIERDCLAVQTYVIQVLKATAGDMSPLSVFESLAKPDALIDKNLCCHHVKPSRYVQEILKKHRIRMGRDYEKKRMSWAPIAQSCFHGLWATSKKLLCRALLWI